MQQNSGIEDEQISDRSLTRTVLKWFAFALTLLLLVAVVAYWLARQEPEFYSAAMQMSDHEAFEAGESLEIAALYFGNDVVEQETWVAEFHDTQINGWLASDLNRKFSNGLPDEIRDPRVGIEAGEFRLALTTEIRGVETVLNAAIEFFPTGDTNQFGLRVLSVKAGWLPIPISFFTQPATTLLKKNRIGVQWFDDSEGVPVALLSVPQKQLSYQGHSVLVEQIELVDGSILLAGRSKPPAEDDQEELEQDDANLEDPDSRVADLLPVSD